MILNHGYLIDMGMPLCIAIRQIQEIVVLHTYISVLERRLIHESDVGSWNDFFASLLPYLGCTHLILFYIWLCEKVVWWQYLY